MIEDPLILVVLMVGSVLQGVISRCSLWLVELKLVSAVVVVRCTVLLVIVVVLASASVAVPGSGL